MARYIMCLGCSARAEWYPVGPVCDLDKRKPHAKRVMGLDVVVWWDRNESEWKVFDDSCAHGLAPLSEGGLISGASCSVSTMAGVLMAGTPRWSSGKNKSGICSSYNSGIHPVALPIPKY
ncbi:hypothetical protein PVL29_007055 [Vitis rotundifolia]|uniref:Rieske domain-containing protein n=1 Tax=Vitis rotundifolia TaxID=103349 RepID=A0AA38ZZF6_VITRO|nr:hypothetical protein PVL29_007055 [Vitis rotundifolia]